MKHMLNAVILEQGLKKKAISRFTGIKPWRLSKIISGDVSPSDAERASLAQTLGRSQRELFDGAPQK
jgi:Helix-turn-helix